MLNKHSKIKTIINALKNASGIAYNELKSILNSKGFSTNEDSNLAKLIINIRNNTFGTALPEDVAKGKIFSSNNKINQIGTLDTSKIIPSNIANGVTIGEVTGILVPINLSYNGDSGTSQLSYSAPYLGGTGSFDNLLLITRFKILYSGYFGINIAVALAAHGSDHIFHIYINNKLRYTKIYNNDMDNDASVGEGVLTITFSANVGDIVEFTGELSPNRNQITVFTNMTQPSNTSIKWIKYPPYE